ncbi:MAG: D-methionine ABC transporter, permease protein [uncultured bacterium]|nr:MAG: D-methionine ABC transporter, permease protein [uncultured bacterium]OGT25764.1 MAG: methionine ABC transporter permease [Gammaproteobacteria bacterium RIFCSPHIGHO2_02_FULL_42_43]OGT51712.1 MAG: methionine ABC transporter permease [Gammaproteobacteria bacterium RIFCSPHIGHO2_12_FULL_41_25]OGT61609.1 MAG: methionine ABC transporter permease [Gammaproteobacteria bacterium RIFCSPLOWO2_02_FULL_42_14]OGT86233.1 MAG: methionine ABC transporter permease [Gammaproteobacteria bacterium RIFCSPLOWO
MWADKITLLTQATWQTIEMVVVSCCIAVIIGLPLGVILFITRNPQLFQKPALHQSLGIIVNVIRSIPFIILLVAITPFTRWIVGTSIGTVAAMVPLAVSAIPFFARLTESAINEVPVGLIEAAMAMGASTVQTVRKVLIPEASASIIRAITLTAITLVGYSAMAGAIGGGGLGNVAIEYGYERFEIRTMVATVIILIIMVQCLQWIGDKIISRRKNHV